MKKIFISIGLLLFLTLNVSAARFGSGKINIDQSFRDHFQSYLVEVKDNPNYVFVYLANHEGDKFWQAWNFGNWQKATEEGIKGCNKIAKKNGHTKCRILAKGRKIFWKWDQLENELYKNKKEIISSKDVTSIIGSGIITLSTQVENQYNLVLKDMNDFTDKTTKYMFYIAVSKDGRFAAIKSGSMPPNSVTIRQIETDIKKSAVASCMTINYGKQCFLYASHDGILWKF